MKGALLALVAIGLLVSFPTFVSPPPEPAKPVGVAHPLLQPTAHDPLPEDPEAFLIRPLDPGVGATARFARFVEGVRLYERRSDLERALSLVNSQALDSTSLAGYGRYYTGLIQLELFQLDEARRTFAALAASEPLGYLAEAVLWAEALVAEAQEDYAGATTIYATLAERTTRAPDEALSGLGRSALASGQLERAAEAFGRLYDGYPLSDLSEQAGKELEALRQSGVPVRRSVGEDLTRAEHLFAHRRYGDARNVLVDLRGRVTGEMLEQVEVRLGASEFHVRRFTQARDRLAPYLERGSHRAEAQLYHARAIRALRRHDEFVERIQGLVARFPKSRWAASALDVLGTHYILIDQDAEAARVFGTLFEQFPDGPYAERAAWKHGWWAYQRRQYSEAIRAFERAAAEFPRSDYRPAYLYWSGRAYARLGRLEEATARLRLTIVDYGSSYYGRLASAELRQVSVPEATSPAIVPSPTADPPAHPRTIAGEAAMLPGPPPSADLIGTLLSLELYDAALDELNYTQRNWNDSARIQATLAWVHNRRGELRRGINAMKRAYPHYLTHAGVNLPRHVLEVVFPLAYWELIQGHAEAQRLDPYLLAALVAQESNFDASIRSSANAYGLMQILPATGRQLARDLGIRGFSTRSLTRPEINVRLGTTYLSKLLAEFGEPHLALAAYNAGARRVRRWQQEHRDLEPAEFVETIPFPETQNYVKRILGTAEDYRRLYDPSTRRAGDQGP